LIYILQEAKLFFCEFRIKRLTIYKIVTNNVMGVIKVENIRVYAYHGCLKEETKIGSDYRVDLKIKANLKPSSITDELVDTVDYVFLNKRILDRIFKEDAMVAKATVWVSKLNPPIGGDVERVTIKMKDRRKN